MMISKIYPGKVGSCQEKSEIESMFDSAIKEALESVGQWDNLVHEMMLS
jgi:hypothetical protein